MSDVSDSLAHRPRHGALASAPTPRPRDSRWVPSAVPDVLIKLDGHDQIADYRLERPLEPRDINTLAEAANSLPWSGQTLVNWKKKNPAFPLKKMGGQWVAIRPFLDAFLLHGDAAERSGKQPEGRQTAPQVLTTSVNHGVLVHQAGRD